MIGAGGFLPGADSSASLASPSKESARRNTNASTRPVTLRQIADASVFPQDSSVTIDGVPVGEVTVVACVAGVRSMETSRTLLLDDGSARVEAKIWNPTEEHDAYQEGTWIRLFGTIKTFQNHKNISATYLRTIVEMNEVFYHILASLEAHLVLTRGLLSEGEKAGSLHAAASNDAFPISSGDMLSQIIANFTPIQRDVFALYKQHSGNENGVEINQVIRAFRGKYDHKEVVKTSEHLIEEGYLYVTIDNNHARCTTF